jgi:hypothetical protein
MMANILLLSAFDNGQQLQNLAEAFRRYTKHDATHINLVQSYLNYDADVKLPTITDCEQFTKLLERAASCDFFIFSEVMPTGMERTLNDLHVYDKIHQSNTIIRTAGSVVRSQSDTYRSAWIDDDWMFAGPVSDWSLSGSVGRIAPVNYICPVDKIPNPKPVDDVVRIAFSPTKKEKGIDEFRRVLCRLKKEYDTVVSVPIVGKSWKESVEIKSTCHITFDQFMIPTYANSSIESMWLGHTVISDISSWCRVVHPNLPIISAHTEMELYAILVDLIENNVPGEIGKECKEYVQKHHHPEIVVKQWEHLIDHVRQK